MTTLDVEQMRKPGNRIFDVGSDELNKPVSGTDFSL